ncbi:MAG TPA: MAPEG family protein [Gammaproteobacteria bacterium]|nr:MAPEG family protein [Gammaproteobacteria bacterium]
MEPVFIVLLIALLEYLTFGGLVARARATYGVQAPATTGDPTFERIYRVQQNTLENLVVFVPAIWIFGLYVDPLWASGLGVLFVVGRAVYAAAYIKAADKRGPGAALTGLTNGVLVIGALVGVVIGLL